MKVKEKPIGLTEDMVAEIEANPEMEDVLKLHKYICKIKNRQNEVSSQVKELRSLFDNLDSKMSEVANAQKPSKKNMDDMKAKDKDKK